MRVYILLDRSGSMATQWNDTLGAINAYVTELPGDTNVYIACFDSGYNLDVNYDVLRNTTVKGYTPLTINDASPRGGTPLYDSAARLLDTAFKESPDKAYIIFMTDGYENTSKKFNQTAIKEKIARAEDRKWEVVFLGANFDKVTDQATAMGVNFNKSYNISTSNLSDEMKFMATNTMAYASHGTATLFSDSDRKRATSNKK
jgi:uncharacterized protein with von Willebrand factor type A (vWA) domain